MVTLFSFWSARLLLGWTWGSDASCSWDPKSCHKAGRILNICAKISSSGPYLYHHTLKNISLTVFLCPSSQSITCHKAICYSPIYVLLEWSGFVSFEKRNWSLRELFQFRHSIPDKSNFLCTACSSNWCLRWESHLRVGGFLSLLEFFVVANVEKFTPIAVIGSTHSGRCNTVSVSGSSMSSLESFWQSMESSDFVTVQVLILSPLLNSYTQKKSFIR